MKGSNTIQIFQDNISEYLAIVVSMTNFGFFKISSNNWDDFTNKHF